MCVCVSIENSRRPKSCGWHLSRPWAALLMSQLQPFEVRQADNTWVPTVLPLGDPFVWAVNVWMFVTWKWGGTASPVSLPVLCGGKPLLPGIPLSSMWWQPCSSVRLGIAKDNMGPHMFYLGVLTHTILCSQRRMCQPKSAASPLGRPTPSKSFQNSTFQFWLRLRKRSVAHPQPCHKMPRAQQNGSENTTSTWTSSYLALFRICICEPPPWAALRFIAQATHLKR